eukprot:1161103-Pelagomonas_calceolata.AAC.7
MLAARASESQSSGTDQGRETLALTPLLLTLGSALGSWLADPDAYNASNSKVIAAASTKGDTVSLEPSALHHTWL